MSNSYGTIVDGHDLPSYNSLIGAHTDIGETVPTTTTGGLGITFFLYLTIGILFSMVLLV